MTPRDSYQMVGVAFLPPEPGSGLLLINYTCHKTMNYCMLQEKRENHTEGDEYEPTRRGQISPNQHRLDI